MGDRAGVAVKDFGKTVYLYTHWGGSELVGVTRKSLARAQARWTDGAYLARMIFEDMIDSQDGRGGETGFGIMPEPSGEEDPLVLIDCDNGTVVVQGRGYPRTPVPIEVYVDSGVH